jgi:hypothetical protein
MFAELRKAILNLSIILTLVFAGIMTGMNYLIINQSRGWYINQKTISVLFKLSCFFLILFYTAMVALVILKYSVKRKLCTVTNVKLLSVSFILFYPLSWQVDKIRSHKQEVFQMV